MTTMTKAQVIRIEQAAEMLGDGDIQNVVKAGGMTATQLEFEDRIVTIVQGIGEEFFLFH